MLDNDEAPQFTREERTVVFMVAILLFVFAFIPPIEFLVVAVFILYVIMRITTSEEGGQASSQIEIVDGDTPWILNEVDTLEVPAKCPSCGEGLGLNTIKWIDERTGICPFCEAIITAK